jgi:hypothetical protein
MNGREEEIILAIGRKARGKKTTRKPRHRWKDAIKMDLLVTGLGGVDWIGLAQDRYMWTDLVNVVMNRRIP